MPHAKATSFEPLEPRALLSSTAQPLPIPSCPPPWWYPREALVGCVFDTAAARISFSRNGDATTAHVVIYHPDLGYRIPDWGTVQRNGDSIRVDMKFEDWTGPAFQAETEVHHDYDLGPLPDGEYTFTLSVWGQDVETAFLKAPATRLTVVEGEYQRDDHYRLSLDANGDILLDWLNAPAGRPKLVTIPPSSVDHLLFEMIGSGDSIELDLINGTPLPAGGMAFNAGFDGPLRPQSVLNIVNASTGDLVEHTDAGLFVNGRRIIFNGPKLAGVAGRDYDVVSSASRQVVVNTGQHLRSLSISGDTRAYVGPAAGTWDYVLSTNALTISDRARLDLKGELHLWVPADDERQALRMLNDYIAAGRGGGAGGIVGSFQTAHSIALGIDRALSSASTSVLAVLHTYAGDFNLDKRVNADDYFKIDQGFLAQPAEPTYADGDINYDGTINADDYFLIDKAFLGQPSLLTASGSSLPLPSTPAAPPTTSVTVKDPLSRRKTRRVRPPSLF